MEFKTLEFDDRLGETASFSQIYSSPYHSFHPTPANYSWNESSAQLSQPFSTDVLQMHHLRFPTPPNTPPTEPVILAGKYLKPEARFHQRTHSVIMKVGSCRQMCESTLSDFSDKDDRRIHSSFNKTTSNDYICSWIYCKRSFESLENLAAHVNKVHAIASVKDGLYYCRWDGCCRYDRGFNARYKMLVHVRTHTKEKPHHCHLCDKSFSRAENLKIHIRSHSGEKPYICTYEGCTKAYSNSSDRFKHTRTHSMEKPYLCKVPGCQKRYTDPSSLRKHIKTFKHSEQLIDSNIMTNASPIKLYRDQDLIKGRSINFESNFNSNTEKLHRDESWDNKANFCIEDEFNLKSWVNGKEVNYHSWNSDKVKLNASYSMHKVDINLDRELPLDLRINRV